MARLVRTVFDLGENEPVPHVVNSMERHGFFVFGLPIDMGKLDAFSAWANIDVERPVVSVFHVQAGDRLRFSAAHELGHLILHKDRHLSPQQAESEANQFAAEFLLPEQAMKETLPEALNLSITRQLKREWRVSMQMLIRRAFDLGIITQNRYRTLFREISLRGWRTTEPIPIPVERPRLMRKMAEMIYGTDARDMHLRMAQAMSISPEFAQEILNEYAKPAPSGDGVLRDTKPYNYPDTINYN